mmetsp:Transcript_20397/g.57454  ORF Transcript_20397/g.57454 Transcript_20397/m.57454 type:complete len:231 (-) Transcript_20397:39-731(-)
MTSASTRTSAGLWVTTSPSSCFPRDSAPTARSACGTWTSPPTTDRVRTTTLRRTPALEISAMSTPTPVSRTSRTPLRCREVSTRARRRTPRSWELAWPRPSRSSTSDSPSTLPLTPSSATPGRPPSRRRMSCTRTTLTRARPFRSRRRGIPLVSPIAKCFFAKQKFVCTIAFSFSCSQTLPVVVVNSSFLFKFTELAQVTRVGAFSCHVDTLPLLEWEFDFDSYPRRENI